MKEKAGFIEDHIVTGMAEICGTRASSAPLAAYYHEPWTNQISH